MKNEAPEATPSHTSLIRRRHPASPAVPYALDPHTIGLHCLLKLHGPFAHYIRLIPFLNRLNTLTTATAVDREHELLRLAWVSSVTVGSVYDIPTAAGWAVFQKAARTDLFIATLLSSTQSTYSLPHDLLRDDDIRPDHALSEVSPYTEVASILYEACDHLMLSASFHQDIHLRNLYPHSIWTSGFLFSEAQVRRLAPVAPPPRVFSRVLECPIAGELLAVPGVVNCHGWITFFDALVPTYLEGGISFETDVHRRFVPRSTMSQKSAPASLLMEDLTFPELYYLVRLEEIASSGKIRAVYHEHKSFEDMSLGLMDEIVDKTFFCESRGLRIERKPEGQFSVYERLAKRSKDANRALARAEQFMCNESSGCHERNETETTDMEFVYKRDARVDYATLDGYDGWSDEELRVKKYKAWAKYEPTVMLPAEVAAMYLYRGFHCYTVCGVLRIIRAGYGATAELTDGKNDFFVPDGVNWSELRPLLARCTPTIKHAADRLLLSLMVAGHIHLLGYFYCVDISEVRHTSRRTGVFMDEPLWVLGFKVPEARLSMQHKNGECLIIPVSPACTILMRRMTEKYSHKHGRVYHSDEVAILPIAVRLGERRHLRWYRVGAGAWEPSSDPPRTLIEFADSELQKLSCVASSGEDNVTISAQKGLSSVRLRDISIEAGWSSWSPHLLISGKGKRISTSVQTHSLTHLVEVFRRLRDSQKNCSLSLTIQELAGMVLLKEVLLGALRIMHGCPWAPNWKLGGGFVVPHAVNLPRGAAVKPVSPECMGLLLTRDTMAIFNVKPQLDHQNMWDVRFVRMDNDIESEKLLLGPAYEGFVWSLVAGRVKGPQGDGGPEMEESKDHDV